MTLTLTNISRHSITPLSNPKHTQGFTLLEALVALVIISLGLLGIAAMNAVAINNSSVARTRSMASLLASSLAARIGANKAYWGGITTNGQSTGLTPPNNFTITWSSTGATLSNPALDGLNQDCSTTACTATEMAAYDLKQWGHDLKWSPDGGTTWYWRLPEAQGTINCNSSTKPNECLITISWTEKNQQLKHDISDSTASNSLTYKMLVKP